MKVAIIEDNFSALQELQMLLQDNHPDVKILGTAATQTDAIQLLAKLDLDLVFMDIELGDGGSGFEVLELMQKPDLHVVFMSSFSKYATKAFRVDNALDFLEKPIDEDQLAVSIQRAKDEINQRKITAAYQQTLTKTTAPARPRIMLSDQQRMIFPYIDTIVHIKADGVTSQFYFDVKPEKMLVTKNIGEFKDLTQSYAHIFMQVHRSHVVNLTKVEQYLRADKLLILSNGNQVPIAIDHVPDFLKRLGS
jgi:two-component system, LytTR family, response regulator